MHPVLSSIGEYIFLVLFGTLNSYCVSSQAVDDDQPTTANSVVHYRIDRIPPGLESNFTIDSVSGEITLEEPLDYEKLDPALRGKIVLEVVAHDSGTPQKSSTVYVNITVEVGCLFPIICRHDDGDGVFVLYLSTSWAGCLFVAFQ